MRTHTKGISTSVIAIVVIVIIVVAAAGVYYAYSRSTGSSTTKTYNVAYLSWDLSIGGGFFVNLTNTLQAILSSYNINLHFFYASDPSTQASQADALLSATPKYDAVIISALDYNAIIPKNLNFNHNNIPVFYLCCGPNATALAAQGGSYVNLVQQDNVLSAADETTFLINYLETQTNFAKPYSIVILNGAQSTTPAVQRAQGIHSVLDPLVKDGTVTMVSEQYGDWTTPTAKTEMDNILSSHPNIDAVLATQDAMAIGAVDSLSFAGKLNNPTVVVGHDCVPTGLQAVASGQELACFINTGSQQAYWTGQIVANYLLEKGLSPVTADHDMNVFAGVATKNNITAASDMPALPSGTYPSGSSVVAHTYSAASGTGGNTPSSIAYTIAILWEPSNFLQVATGEIRHSH